MDIIDVQDPSMDNPVQENGPKVKCIECDQEIEMLKLREHQEQHQPRKRKRQAMMNDVLFVESSEGDDPLSSTSSAAHLKTSTVEEDIDQLSEMFPNEPRHVIENCLKEQGTVTKAVINLLQPKIPVLSDDDADLMNSAFEVPDSSCHDNQHSLSEELEKLKNNFDNGPKEKLKVDEDDILNDAMTFYKDSDFNPSKRLRIVYSGQPAADTGGVVRQFYTQLLIEITESFFQGKEYRSPIYNSDTVASGVMKMVGTIIVHSILQGGPGLPVFSPGIYYYLAKGNVEEAMDSLTVIDCSLEMRDFIAKVAAAEDVASLDEEEVIAVLANCGLTMALTNDNKVRVIRNLIVHDAIARPKIVLDQLREGLKTLGFAERMQLYPDLFKGLFVAGESELNADQVKNKLQFPSDLNADEENVKDYLLQFLRDAPIDQLKSFLVFATGSPGLPQFGLGIIKIEFDDRESIFSSTCTFRITLPRSFPDQVTFSSALAAVCKSSGKAFSSV